MPKASVTEVTFPARDGFSLGGTLAMPEGERRGVILINGATAVRCQYYGRFATWLAEQGWQTLIYDYRGIGKSRPKESLRTFKGTLRQWGEEDFSGALNFAERELKAPKVSVIGHSVGGQLLGLGERLERVERAFFVSAQSGDFRNWPLSQRWKMVATMFAVIPAASAALGYMPGKLGMGEDLPGGVASEWARWCRTKDYVVGDDPSRRAQYAKFAGAITALSFTDDPFYAPRAAVDALLGFYPGAKIEHRHTSPSELGAKSIGHFGFFRDSGRETSWPVVSKWLEQQ